MSGVLQLAYLQLFAKGWQRWSLLVGLLAFALCFAYPPATSHWPYMPLVAFAAVTALLLGGARMPVITYRLASGRQHCVLPLGGVRLIISAFLVTTLSALPLPLLIGATMKATFVADRKAALLGFLNWREFLQIYSIVFWMCSALYLIQSLFLNVHRVKGAITAMLAIIALVSVPRRWFMPDEHGLNVFPFVLIAIGWALFSVYVLFYPKWRSGWQGIARRESRIGFLWSWLTINAKQISGQEMALLLGLHSRWTQAISYLIVLVLAYSTIGKATAPRLFYVALFAIIPGAICGVTASKSRALWLRRNWSRDQLFQQIERSVWRQMSLALLVLMLWFVAAGVYFDVAYGRIIVGAVLIALVFSVCLYLSLLATRGMRWADAGVAMAVMLPTLAIAAYGSTSAANDSNIAAFEGLLLIATMLIRTWAKRRWHVIDWMACRPPRFS